VQKIGYSVLSCALTVWLSSEADAADAMLLVLLYVTSFSEEERVWEI
jgi:hypothetical protein